jgi:hypothetical protein
VTKRRVDPVLLEMLRRHGRDYSLREGGSHVHIRVDNELVLVVPRHLTDKGRCVANARATLRRALRRRSEKNAG